MSPDSRFQTAKEMQNAFTRNDYATSEISEKIKKSKIKRKSKALLYSLMLLLMILAEIFVYLN